MTLDNTKKPLFDGQMKYCVRCCMPETERGTNHDELGICKACRSSEQKMHIDWKKREEQLRKIFAEVKANAGDNYHCILPISGGKDSTFQMYVLTQVLGVKPLAVTFCQNWHSKTGWYNLQNALERFNVDHIMFTPNREMVNKSTVRALELIGDPCWECHAGLGAFPLQMAVKLGVPLLVYGEPASEGHALGDYNKPMRFCREYFIEVSGRVRTPDFACEELPEKELAAFQFPSQEEYDAANIMQIHLGSYMFWDDERQTEFVVDNHGWMETEMEPSFKRYKCVECVMPGMHDHTLYLKRGFGRATFQANADVRQGLMTREEGFQMTHKYDCRKPEVLSYFLEQTGLTERELVEVMEKHRKGPLRGMKLPVVERDRDNTERLIPFNTQVVDNYRRKYMSNGEEE